MDIIINSEQYKIHIVNKSNYKMYGNRLDNTYICDTNFVSNSYENLSYSLLEYDNYLGFFLSNISNSTLYVSAILIYNVLKYTTN